MSLTYKPTITDGGIAHAISVNNDGVNFRITHVSFGGTKFEPTGKETSIIDERLKKELSSTARVDDHTFKIRCRARSRVPFYCQSIGFWSDDVLFAVYSSSELPPGGLFNIHNATDTVISYSLSLGKVGADKYEVILMADEDHLLELISEHENDPNAHDIGNLKEQVNNLDINKIDNNKKSNAVNSESQDTVATSLAVKTVNDKTNKLEQNKLDKSALSSSVASADETKASTPKATKTAYDKAVQADNNADNRLSKNGGVVTGEININSSQNKYLSLTDRQYKAYIYPFEGDNFNKEGIYFRNDRNEDIKYIRLPTDISENTDILLDTDIVTTLISESERTVLSAKTGKVLNEKILETREQAVKRNIVKVMTGTAKHNQILPIPSGFTEDQCIFSISLRYAPDSNLRGFYLKLIDKRKVYIIINQQENTGASVNYIVIGVK